MNEMAEDGPGLLVRFLHPTDRENVRILGVAFLMVDLTVDGGEHRRDVLDLMIDHALEVGGVAAKSNGREIDNKVALNDLCGKNSVVVVGVAHARLAHPAEEVACAITDLLVAQQNGFEVPATRAKLRFESGIDALPHLMMKAIENECFHVYALMNCLAMESNSYL